jgi:hypothetical protein
VTVHNAGVGPVQVTSFAATGDFAVVAAQSNCSLTSLLQAGANCFIALQATATVAGPRTGTLTLASTATNSPHTVDLLATGLMPQLTLTPNPLDFGSVQVGTPSLTRFVTVHNAGVGPVQVTSFAATGDFAVVAAQSNCSLTSPLQGGANCFIALQATATVAGPRTGTLTLASTATDTPHLVDLLANGVLETVTVGTLIESLEVGGNGMRINPTKTGSLTISRLALLAEWTLTKSDEAGSLERSPSTDLISTSPDRPSLINQLTDVGSVSGLRGRNGASPFIS